MPGDRRRAGRRAAGGSPGVPGERQTRTGYVAFLRGVNVGGHALVKMDELRQRLAREGFENVRTVKASGNIVLESSSGGPRAVGDRIEGVLRRMTGRPVTVFLRTRSELERIVAGNPFDASLSEGETAYVSFLQEAPSVDPQVPFSSPAGEATVVRVRGRDVYALGRRVGNRPGFPNPFVERWSGAPATTRAWTTVTEIVAVHLPAGPATPDSGGGTPRHPRARAPSTGHNPDERASHRGRDAVRRVR